MNFGRLLTAMVTPFASDNKIDFEQTTKLIEYLLDNGTEGLIVAGTTGESPTLTHEEKVDLFKHVVQVVDKRVPVIAGTGGNNTQASISLTKEAESCGVDGILLVTPYYNKPNQRGLYEHFKMIASETALPIMLYNIPGRSVINMNAETVIQLSKIDNIVSLKEAGVDLDQVATIIEKTDDNFSVYSGNDSMTLPMLAIGANGVVSVSSHVIGNEMKEMIDLFFEGNVKESASLHRELVPVMTGLFSSPSPTPVKAALAINGMSVGSVRLPLVDLTDNEIAKLNSLLNR
ncbi:4-hydroxy-tetrahydrodipicolinate synthase [Oceanobacillus chungangensis]|uniref:4-hydroxy-tetrahydrodipicolinate synthase n=1 Tax=Oceanobacillus chungangensis TaxID=1229152 RepID=A0A3D8PS32_9BACI|nr:4-hydroxy-tetrahydrodipicolinate synthase [Oceanobacillus chungangensis]RDW17785.1 4-hydroxy-tetrahydrodipicolinate synthase [Oceanobacillus chungangensis]